MVKIGVSIPEWLLYIFEDNQLLYSILIDGTGGDVIDDAIETTGR